MKKRIALLIVLVVTGSIYAWLATGKMRFISALEACGGDAKDVVLERYYSGTVLQTARINTKKFTAWIDQLPTGFGRLPYTVSKCWIPHHRIQFDGSTEHEVDICFTCNEIWTEVSGRRKIPEDWRQPLRAMFLAHEISDAAPDAKELRQFWDAIEESEQVAPPNGP